MKRNWKGRSLIGATLVALTLQTACSQSSNGNAASASAQPTAGASASASASAGSKQESITLNGLASKHVFQADWNDMLVFQEREKETGVHVKWENVPDEGWVEKRNLRMATNNLPDFISRSGFSDADIATYSAQGMIIPLNDLIDKHAPNLKAILDADPNIRKAISDVDGNIYALPAFNGWMGDNASKLWINKAWLDKLGMPMPKTLDEYYDALVAFRDKNPGGVSKVIPLTDFSSNFNRDLIYFAGSFGIGNKGPNFLGEGVDLGPDGKMRFVKTDERYKALLQFMNKLWTAKLLDPELLTHKSEAWTANSKAGLHGSFVLAAPESNKSSDYEVLPPLKSEFGDEVLSFVGTGLRKNNTIITSANKHPEQTMEWLDYWYSEEGWIRLQYGIEGVTYTVDKDGGYWWTEKYDPNIAPIEKSRGLFSPMFGDGIPYYMAPDEFTKRPWIAEQMEASAINKVAAAADMLKPYYDPVLNNGVEPFLFTAEELAVKKQFNDEAMQYITEMETKFIMGKEPFSNWDKYVSKVNSLGLDKYMAVYNAALERFKKL
ncbi:extracellular solute-binding protein [Cohnella rhizosphaerae]|uniref:Extracellular solute-binding protein n=1 Tax=Cohnella rhizosphaerae TaxID=1457232 RepID=A0A9X4QT62_9BACL|nr:extracellular solute-binding protein [Cohnella rhizosphaerae]MDG0810029.1 extracellular solute-binding protein [Cohnella rhizosphaerae]